MAITNENLVKFGYGLAEKASKTAGHISFATDTRQLFVGDGVNAVAFAGNVANAVFADKKLTITYNNGTPAAVLDFSDVASAEGVSSLLGGLRKDVTANATAISNLSTAVDTSIKALDASYKAADASLAERIGALEGLVGEGGDVDERIAAAVEAETELRALADSSIRTDFAAADASLDASLKSYADGLDATVRADFAAADASLDASLKSYVDTKVSNLGGSETGVDASGFVTVKVDTTAGQVSGVTVTGSDIASAAELTRVAGRIDTFLDSENVEGVVDTLHEINNWISTSGKDVTDLTEAIAEEARLRDEADKALGLRIDGVKATADAAATQSEFNFYKTTNDAALAGVKATADAAAVKTEVESALALKADKTQVATDISTAKGEAISAAASDATQKANNAETNAKTYADKIKVNGQAQSGQEITVRGLNILVGGNGNHKDSSVNDAIEDLYSKVADASNAARVESLAVKAESSNYAEVNASTGAVTLTIKKVALADATESNTGVADAYDVKTSIATAKSEAISAVQGEEGDASTAATVAGAKVYAKEYANAQIEAAALRWTVLS